jgi:hypothetical protein
MLTYSLQPTAYSLQASGSSSSSLASASRPGPEGGTRDVYLDVDSRPFVGQDDRDETEQ